MISRNAVQYCLIGLLCEILFLASAFSQEKIGCRYLRNYNREDYGLATQNWAILQDSRGIIYAVNEAGLLIYDGATWSGVEVPHLRSLAADEGGVIYVGGLNRLGFIGVKPNGFSAFISLMDRLETNRRDSDRVMRIHAVKEGVYFRTSQFLFRWDARTKQMKTWQPPLPGCDFAGSFVCRGRLFIRQKNLGLMQMVNDKLEPVPGAEIFAQTAIFAMFPYNEQETMIGTDTNGLFLFDGVKMRPFATEVDDYLKEKKLYHGIELKHSPGRFALATLRGGLLIIDSRGRLLEMFTRETGLLDDNVKYVFEDARGSLWLALEKGITKIEYASPFSFYNDKLSNLPGLVSSAARHGPNRDLYVGTTRGLFVLEANGKFRPISGIDSECFALTSTGDSLLAAAREGLFQVFPRSGAADVLKITSSPTYCLLHSPHEPALIWAGSAGAIFALHRVKGRWETAYKIEDIPGETWTIARDLNESLWAGALNGGVIQVDFPVDANRNAAAGYKVTTYNKEHGLPEGDVRVFQAAGHIMFAAATGLYRFEKNKQRFIPDYTLGKEFAGGARHIFSLAEDSNKDIWFHSFYQNFRARRQGDGTYRVDTRSLLRIPPVLVNAIYPDPLDDITWFACDDGLVRFDAGFKKSDDYACPVFIRQLESLDDNSVIVGRNRNDAVFPILRIPYRKRNIRFRYGAPFYEDEAATRYRVFLEGYDKDWSKWSEEHKKEYTNLDGGKYTFRVQAKNVYETVSPEARFSFRIGYPWYRAWWSYFIYVFLFLLAVYFAVKWRSRRLQREKQRLEEIVIQGTKEVYEKNLLLEEQSEKLKELDKTKSRFFANISHEFRTPLTLIMGPLEQTLAGCSAKEQAANIEMALRNSQRLLALINQLLDLAKLESGRMKLQAACRDIIPFLRGWLGAFESTAQQKKLGLDFQAQEEEILIYFDAEKLEKAIVNLVANALKFTPAGGTILITTALRAAAPGKYPRGCLEIKVSDTGIGIAAEQLPYIFDRFYQAGNPLSHEHKYPGTGIGLALAKELIHLHRGDIGVKSEVNKGTEFTIHLPLGKAHLKPEEIIEAPGDKQNREAPRFYIEREISGQSAAGEAGKTAAAEENEEEEPQRGSKEKDVILVVEDNTEVRRYIRQPLLAAYKVIEAADGQEGIDKAMEIIPDLVISDIMMPRVDGYKLCEVLKKDIKTSHIPIILLTARASEESILSGLGVGADDYIIKPFSVQILSARIKNLIDLRRQLQEKIQREMVLQPTEIAVSSMDRQFMEEVKQAIEKNLDDPGFGVDRLAKSLYMGRATLNRKIGAITGESPNQFIQSYRLKRAAQLLKGDFGNITEVSFEVGFSSSGYFTKCFKKKFHQTPHAFQASES